MEGMVVACRSWDGPAMALEVCDRSMEADVYEWDDE